MKTKELKKYPVQILAMTVTFLINLIFPLLLSYLIDDILVSGDMEKLVKWLAVTFPVAAAGIVMKFYFNTYLPVKIGLRNSFTLQKGAAKNILKMNQRRLARGNLSRATAFLTICARCFRKSRTGWSPCSFFLWRRFLCFAGRSRWACS